MDPVQSNDGKFENAAMPTKSKITLPPDSELEFKKVMKRDLVLPIEGDNPWFDIVRTEDHTDAIMLLSQLSRQAPADTVIRWAGGCKGFDAGQVEKLFKFIAKGSFSADGSKHFQGSVGSGGTMDFDKDGEESVMITQVPYYVARLTDSVAWGSTPQTFRLRMDKESGGVIASKYGAYLDPRGHMNVLTQDSATEFQGWNGDVRWYMSAIESMINNGYKGAIGVVNGGDVTQDEALLALSKGIPVIIVEGSGRAADYLISAYRDGNLLGMYNNDALGRGTLQSSDRIPSPEDLANLINIVNIDDAQQLSATMEKLELLT